ncbi:hypothetical protein AK830_g12510 [Neonectria ditissima]|uniref:Uncharacterized protein n=1 Tax=Neonectria ditissima TaxID=78410 RepID=A0A0P7AYW7_9HYPO|nr:hypothetical protein AK830_g12510 [Neonectria ditissima]
MNSSSSVSATQPLDIQRPSRTYTSDHGAGYFDFPAITDRKVTHSPKASAAKCPSLTRTQQRTSSYSSDVSLLDSTPSSSPKSAHTWVKPAATVNVYTTCGRHTDQLLFGGPSLTELARAIMRRH